MTLPLITYQQLEACGIDFSQVFFACKAFDKKRNVKNSIESIDSIYQWRNRGIPRRFLSLVSNQVSNFMRRAADKAALAAAKAPQIDLFTNSENNKEINELSDNLSSFRAPLLANHRGTAAALEPRGFQTFGKLPKEHIDLRALQDVLLADFDASEREFNDDSVPLSKSGRYFHNFDAVAYAQVKEPEKSPYLESYYLSSIVRRIEKHTKIDSFKKMRQQGGILKQSEHSLGAHNCGRRVMGEELAKKIYGDNAPIGSVDVISTNGKLSYKGVMLCKDPWGCPTCARRITERRKNGLSLLLPAHIEKYGQNTISATLFTIPHGLGDDLDDILTRMLKAWRWMTMNNDYKHLMKSHGLRGTVRGFEVTYGKNGFHPHFHVLHFFDRDIKKSTDYSPGGDVEFISHSLFKIWSKALKLVDFKAPNRQAFGCVAIATDKKSLEDVADYFGKGINDVNQKDIDVFLQKHKDTVREAAGTKQRWGVESELTKWHIKSGGDWRYSMFDFLRGFALSDLQGNIENRDIFKNLWLTYRRGFKGKRQLYTHHKDFKIDELELSDHEVSDLESKEEKMIVLSMTFQQWVTVLRCNARAALLRVISKGQNIDDFFSLLDSMLDISVKNIS